MAQIATAADTKRLRGSGPAFAKPRSSMPSPPSASPLILVIGSDPALYELCRDALPWSGCATEFVGDIADAMTHDVAPDIMVADLPAGPHAAAGLMHLREFADAIGSTVIALTTDESILAHADASATCQVLVRPCQPETLWDALAIAMTGRNAARSADECATDQ